MLFNGARVTPGLWGSSSSNGIAHGWVPFFIITYNTYTLMSWGSMVEFGTKTRTRDRWMSGLRCCPRKVGKGIAD